MLRVLCDVHISYRVVKFFEVEGIETIHINNILDGSETKDSKIRKWADENNFVLITKDSDFRNSHFISGSPRKLLKIELGNISTKILLDMLKSNFSLIEESFAKSQCYMELGRDYIKVV